MVSWVPIKARSVKPLTLRAKLPRSQLTPTANQALLQLQPRVALLLVLILVLVLVLKLVLVLVLVLATWQSHHHDCRLMGR